MKQEKRIIVQRGSPYGTLHLYVHIDGNLIRQEAASRAPGDALVTYYCGDFTGSYKGFLESKGGFRNWVRSIEDELSCRYSQVVLTGWSAGGQVLKDVAASSEWPDAMVALDAIYAAKPDGGKPGDGSLQGDAGLSGLRLYALEAAAMLRAFVLTYSGIPTPYASTSECAKWLVREVGEYFGAGVGPDTFRRDLGGRVFSESFRRDNLFVYGFRGNGAKEHVAQARAFPYAWSLLP